MSKAGAFSWKPSERCRLEYDGDREKEHFILLQYEKQELFGVYYKEGQISLVTFGSAVSLGHLGFKDF